ncbi:DUF2752 domain-containing protein [Ruminococcus flavefaciens]|uniref:DUF2752 domain-containing protein n=1 Tax=Ruminococcus flavefaciens TaxID=1265 RepID=UPI000462E90F|nr:DUF2752 domain-containing protein [Ruminococcus flavefaciens]
MSKRLRAAIAIAVPIMALVLLALRDRVIGLAKSLPPCTFHKVTGYWCTGCGNTRSCIALLHGHIWTAIRNNATMPFLSLLLCLLYAENLAAVFGKDIKILPRKTWIWMIVIGLFFVYFIIRNFIPALGPIS